MKSIPFALCFLLIAATGCSDKGGSGQAPPPTGPGTAKAVPPAFPTPWANFILDGDIKEALHGWGNDSPNGDISFSKEASGSQVANFDGVKDHIVVTYTDEESQEKKYPRLTNNNDAPFVWRAWGDNGWVNSMSGYGNEIKFTMESRFKPEVKEDDLETTDPMDNESRQVVVSEHNLGVSGSFLLEVVHTTAKKQIVFHPNNQANETRYDYTDNNLDSEGFLKVRVTVERLYPKIDKDEIDCGILPNGQTDCPTLPDAEREIVKTLGRLNYANVRLYVYNYSPEVNKFELVKEGHVYSPPYECLDQRVIIGASEQSTPLVLPPREPNGSYLNVCPNGATNRKLTPWFFKGKIDYVTMTKDVVPPEVPDPGAGKVDAGKPIQ